MQMVKAEKLSKPVACAAMRPRFLGTVKEIIKLTKPSACIASTKRHSETLFCPKLMRLLIAEILVTTVRRIQPSLPC